EAGAPPIAATSAQRGYTASRTVHLSWLRRRAAQDRRRGQRDPRLRAGPVQKPALAKAGVVRHIREKLSCRVCDTVVAAPAPDHAIARGRAGAGLLAHIVVSKYDDHLPLYRQAEISPVTGSAWRPRPCPAGLVPRRRR